MKSVLKWSMSTITAVSMLFGLAAFQKRVDLREQQAIKLAEQFIIDNGYTRLPADKSKISYYPFPRYENTDSIIVRRYNTLQSKAFCVSEDEDRWDVGFLSADIDLSKLDSLQRQGNLPGRAVIVMKNGKVSIAHKTPIFSYFKKL